MDSPSNKAMKQQRKLNMLKRLILDIAIIMDFNINQNFFKNMTLAKTYKILKKLCKKIYLKTKQMTHSVNNPVTYENKD